MVKYNVGDTFVIKLTDGLEFIHMSPYFLDIATIKSIDVDDDDTVWYECYHPLKNNPTFYITQTDVDKKYIPVATLEKMLSDEIFNLQNNLYVIRSIGNFINPKN